MKKGFSLPLWLAASSKSALKNLLGLPFNGFELIKDVNSSEEFQIKVHSVAQIKNNSESLAITFAESGLDLDLTNNLEIWTIVSFVQLNEHNINDDLIKFIPGEGVGINANTQEICISDFAKLILRKNLLNLIPSGYKLNLKIIFPKGKFLSKRTSNNAFGIVEGLSIIGTTADTYASASQEQLENAKKELDLSISDKSNEKITFVIGENGLDIAKRESISTPIIKIGNWIGPLLVYAAAKNIKEVLIVGYHGKLIKLAGGIFHTHNHLADGRIEILCYLAFQSKIPLPLINNMSKADTIEEALIIVEGFNQEMANLLWNKIANTVEERSKKYINKYIDSQLLIGVVLFDRKRRIRWKGNNGLSMFTKLRTFKE